MNITIFFDLFNNVELFNYTLSINYCRIDHEEYYYSEKGCHLGDVRLARDTSFNLVILKRYRIIRLKDELLDKLLVSVFIQSGKEDLKRIT